MRDDATFWWSGGVRFSCKGCGACCGGSPGTVSFTDQERDLMADRLGVSLSEFERLYVWYKYDGRRSLREKDDYDCILLDSSTKRCTVYDVRPSQCRTFPFWSDVLASPRSWARYSRNCPGMDDGETHTEDEIINILEQRS